MNEKDIMQKLIDNSKLIHKLGGWFKVENGDWALCEEQPCLIVQVYSTHYGPDETFVKFNYHHKLYGVGNLIPIWEARKCKQWLMNRGYSGLSYFDASKNGWIFDVMSNEEVENLNFKAATEDEACTDAVIEILEKEKNA